MSSGDQLQKRAYLRSLSTKIRKWHVRTGLSFIVEDPVIGGVEGLARSIMITVCRNRQRLLQQAWNYWTTNTGVTHDYTEDLTAILIHPLDADQMRTELEIEVIYKWMKQQSDRDYTGIAHTVMSCSSRRAIVNLLQSCRLERYAPGEPIIFQSALPRPEDGHFTVLRGSCDCVRLPPESVAFSRLQGAVKRRQWDAARDLLGHRGNESGASSTAAEAKDVKGNNHSHGSVLAHLLPPAGFGELSAMTNVARAVTVRASWNSAPEGPAPPADVMTETAVSPLNSKTVPRTLPTAGSNGFFGGTENVISIPKGHTDVLVVPKETFTACVAARRKASLRGAAPSEAIELFRQTGLAKGVQSKDLMRAANSMSKHVLQEGDVIFCRGQKADRLFLVVSGDVVLDTSALNATNTDSEGRFVPFMHSQSSDVFHVSGGTVLGDEGLTGAESVYTSTAAVASQMAVIFEAQPSGYAHYFLTQRVNGIRYSALAYKDLPRWTVPIAEAEDSNLYSHLNSLR